MTTPTLAAAAVCDGRGGFGLAALPVPELGAGEILLRLRCAGLCGTDLWKLRHGTAKPGSVLGHEVVGVVEDAGDGAHFVPGDRLVVVHHVPCGVCRFCRAGSETMCPAFRTNLLAPGGFSELVLVRAAAARHGAFNLPAHVSDAAAVFLEPAACVLRGIRRAGLLTPDAISLAAGWRAAPKTDDGTDDGAAGWQAGARAENDNSAPEAGGVIVDRACCPVIAIQGAGSMGLLHLLLLRALALPAQAAPPSSPSSPSPPSSPSTSSALLAASSAPLPRSAPLVVLSDPLAERRDLALKLGADAVASPGDAFRHSVMELSQGRGADLVFDTVGGAAPLAEALELGRPGTAVVLFAHAAAALDEPAGFALNSFFKAERRLIAAYSSAPAEQRAAYHLLVSRRLDPSALVTHLLPLSRAAEAVDLATSRRALKILLVPDADFGAATPRNAGRD
jgi:threonine dehydrogenase-like Zn-dependent dehydrogenase